MSGGAACGRVIVAVGVLRRICISQRPVSPATIAADTASDSFFFTGIIASTGKRGGTVLLAGYRVLIPVVSNKWLFHPPWQSAQQHGR